MQEIGDVARIVLEVGVHFDQNVRAQIVDGILEAAKETDANAALVHVQQMDARILHGHPVHNRQGAVLGVAVGHQHV